MRNKSRNVELKKAQVLQIPQDAQLECLEPLLECNLDKLKMFSYFTDDGQKKEMPLQKSEHGQTQQSCSS